MIDLWFEALSSRIAQQIYKHGLWPCSAGSVDPLAKSSDS